MGHAMTYKRFAWELVTTLVLIFCLITLPPDKFVALASFWIWAEVRALRIARKKL